MEHRRRQAAARRLRCVIALAGDYLKYIFMKRRRLLRKVARRTLALVHRHGERSKSHPWPRALMEHEFSCADSPSPAFLAAKRLRSRLLKGGAAAGAVSSCFGALRASCGSPATTTAATEMGPVELEPEEDDDEQVAGDEWVAQCGELLDVDDRAEEFINMFYEQLRAQSFDAVFQFSP